MKDFKDIILLSFLRCLEREGCAGIYWSFKRPRKLCSTYIIDKVNQSNFGDFINFIPFQAYETLASQFE